MKNTKLFFKQLCYYICICIWLTVLMLMLIIEKLSHYNIFSYNANFYLTFPANILLERTAKLRQ